MAPLLSVTAATATATSAATTTRVLLNPFYVSPPFSRLCSTLTRHQATCYVGSRVYLPFDLKKRGRALVVKASADVDGTASDDPNPPSGSEEENEDIPIGDLPLESKLQLKLEQKMKMKLAKKIRLRRKKLVRKRRLRKKGRWPPSKMKKNQNV